MDIRSLLDDPAAAIAARWGSADTPQAIDAQHQIEQLALLKPQLKAALERKQLCAREFGAAKRSGEPLELLKARMQQISTEIEQLEQTQAAAQQALLDLFSPKPADTGADLTLPERFRTQRNQACGDTSVTEIDERGSADWDRYVGSHPNASLYHRYLWRSIIERSFNQRCIYLAARDPHGNICGVLPLVRLRSRLFGDFNVSLPYFNYGGVLADNTKVADQLLQHAAALTRTNGQRHLEVRATTRLNDWPVRTDKVSMILPLPTDIETLEAQLGSKLRAQINRARREQPSTHCGGIELLDDFYRVFARNMRDLGTPVYARHFFANILQALPQQAHLVVIRLHNRPVAAAFLLGDRDLMEIPWASTLREVNALSMNMLLYREVLHFAIGLGYPFFDFGRSTQDAGTYRFKRQWGAQPLQHYWHYALPEGAQLPELKPDSPKFRLLIRCWQRLPVPLANLIGPPIVRNLP